MLLTLTGREALCRSSKSLCVGGILLALAACTTARDPNAPDNIFLDIGGALGGYDTYIDQRKDELAIQKQKLYELQVRRSQLESELDEAEARQQVLQSEISTLQKETLTLKSKSQALSVKSDKAIQKKAKLDQKRDELEAEIAMLSELNPDTLSEDQITKMEERLIQLQAERDILLDEYESF